MNPYISTASQSIERPIPRPTLAANVLVLLDLSLSALQVFVSSLGIESATQLLPHREFFTFAAVLIAQIATMVALLAIYSRSLWNRTFPNLSAILVLHLIYLGLVFPSKTYLMSAFKAPVLTIKNAGLLLVPLFRALYTPAFLSILYRLKKAAFRSAPSSNQNVAIEKR